MGLWECSFILFKCRGAWGWTNVSCCRGSNGSCCHRRNVSCCRILKGGVGRSLWAVLVVLPGIAIEVLKGAWWGRDHIVRIIGGFTLKSMFWLSTSKLLWLKLIFKISTSIILVIAKAQYFFKLIKKYLCKYSHYMLILIIPSLWGFIFHGWVLYC